MTPAIIKTKSAKKNYHIHNYKPDPMAESYGEEAAEKLGVSAGRLFKTLVVILDGKKPAIAVVPAANQLDLKKYADSAGAKKAGMADKRTAEKVTGYVLGGISPIGQKQRLFTIIDESAGRFETVFCSAGKRGLSLELAPDDLSELTDAKFAAISK